MVLELVLSTSMIFVVLGLKTPSLIVVVVTLEM